MRRLLMVCVHTSRHTFTTLEKGLQDHEETAVFELHELVGYPVAHAAEVFGSRGEGHHVDVQLRDKGNT